ncbi:MAG: DUF4230 domain-containing protein [Bacteroides sp.]|nr:DUF4230 domain-containing protein [Bacteroides sp.]
MNTKHLLILFTTLLLTLFSSCKEKADPETEIARRLRDVSRLELAQMTIGKVGMISDHKYEDAKSLEDKTKAMLNAMKIGNRIGVYSYDTYLIAYIDLSELSADDIEFDPNTNVAHVNLPSVKIITDGREPELHEVHYRVTGFRSSIKPEERAKLKAQMAAEVKKEVAGYEGSKELLRDEARKKAVSWFNGIIESWGYIPNITFKD